MSTIYKALTPHGPFQAEWGDEEDSRVQYSGSADAIAFFRAFLDLNSLSGPGGSLIQFDTLEPAELYGFCQSEKYGISVLPTDDDLMDEYLEGNTMTTSTIDERLERLKQRRTGEAAAVMDAVTAAEAFELIGEGVQILARLDENAGTFFADLDRLRHIVTQLGNDVGPVDGAGQVDAAAAAYLQSVIDGTVNLADPAVADELGKIHGEHAGNVDMLALFKTAVKAYAAFAIARADAALAQGNQ